MCTTKVDCQSELGSIAVQKHCVIVTRHFSFTVLTVLLDISVPFFGIDFKREKLKFLVLVSEHNFYFKDNY